MKQKGEIVSQGLTVVKHIDSTYSFFPYIKIRKYCFFNLISYRFKLGIHNGLNNTYFFSTNGFISRETEKEALQLLRDCIYKYKKQQQKEWNHRVMISKDIEYELHKMDPNQIMG